MSHPGRLRHRVGEAIAKHALWSEGARVAVAVSGRMDSMALLDLLVQTSGWHKGVLSVVTVDHGTRPDSSQHADFVERRAAELGLVCVRVDRQLGPQASEVACRVARLEAFDALDVDVVATAHHRDDQAETLLLQLLRGAGTTGLGAMRWRSGTVVRPLLNTSRDDIRAWMTHRELDWLEDPSNSDPRFLRNRVRSEVMPLLERLRPGASATMARSARVSAEEDAYIQGQLPALPDPASPFPLQLIQGLPAVLARRVVRAWAGRSLSAAAVDAVLDAVAAGLPVGRIVHMVRGSEQG